MFPCNDQVPTRIFQELLGYDNGNAYLLLLIHFLWATKLSNFVGLACCEVKFNEPFINLS